MGLVEGEAAPPFKHVSTLSVGLSTGHYWKCEPANISSLAPDKQTQMSRNVLKRIGMDDNSFLGNMLSP
jgi:hypothetical protein